MYESSTNSTSFEQLTRATENDSRRLIFSAMLGNDTKFPNMSQSKANAKCSRDRSFYVLKITDIKSVYECSNLKLSVIFCMNDFKYIVQLGEKKNCRITQTKNDFHEKKKSDTTKSP